MACLDSFYLFIFILSVFLFFACFYNRDIWQLECQGWKGYKAFVDVPSMSEEVKLLFIFRRHCQCMLRLPFHLALYLIPAIWVCFIHVFKHYLICLFQYLYFFILTMVLKGLLPQVVQRFVFFSSSLWFCKHFWRAALWLLITFSLNLV